MSGELGCQCRGCTLVTIIADCLTMLGMQMLLQQLHHIPTNYTKTKRPIKLGVPDSNNGAARTER